MDLRQLRYFLAVAKTKGFNEAAAQLRIAQSSVSRRIHDLEADLGVALFERYSRGTKLTDAGRILMGRAEALLQDVEAARAEIVARSAEPSGAVTVGASPGFSATLFAPLAFAVKCELPRVQLRFVESIHYGLCEGVDSGRIDLAVMVDPDEMRSWVLQPLVVEQLYFVTAATEKQKIAEIEPTEIIRKPLVLFPRPTALHDRLDRIAEEAGAKLDVRYEITGLESQKALIQHGLVCGILPQSSIRENLRRKSLVAIPIRGFSITRALVSRRDRTKSPAVGSVASVIFRTIRKLVPDSA
jgi:LysR family transcriptional regulator, nitrogen assimilation regulatory protein